MDFSKYTTEQLINALAKATYAAAVHEQGGRFYMAELCQKRADELTAAINSSPQ